MLISYEAIKTDVKLYKIWNSKYSVYNFYIMNLP